MRYFKVTAENGFRDYEEEWLCYSKDDSEPDGDHILTWYSYTYNADDLVSEEEAKEEGYDYVEDYYENEYVLAKSSWKEITEAEFVYERDENQLTVRAI